MSRDALIVGINQYQNLPGLTAAAQDAEGIANTLETYGGFRVRRLPEVIETQRPKVGQQTPVSAQQLENSLIRLLLPKGDHIPETVFFYFSGHGLQRDMGIREGYLATSDTQPDTSNSGLSLSWLRRIIKHSPVRQILVVLDCCHSGEFLSLKDEAWQGSDGQSYLFMAASREYEEAYESLNSSYSVLTQAILTGLVPQQSGSARVTSTDLIAFVANQLSSELQQPLFEQGGSEILITYQAERPRTKSESISIISRLKQYSFNFCPYRGSQPFEEKHAAYFFGREALIEDFFKVLEQTNICTLVGASGSGKTSLLRAGIIPRLAGDNDTSESEHWIRYLTPGTQPLKSLAAAFATENQQMTVANQLFQTEDLLRNQSDGLVNLITATVLERPHIKKIWLIIDQFEALLTPTADLQIKAERQQIIQGLVTAARCPELALGIIISLRTDSLDNLLNYDDLFSLVAHSRIAMTPMSYQEIRDVIEKPAEKLGLKIDPYLVHNLTLDLTGAPGELALLQNTLYELWRHRTSISYSKGSPCLSLDSYLKLGKLSAMVTDRATALYQSLSSEEQPIARRILISLCDLGDGRFDQCRQVYKSELINQKFSQSSIDSVLKKLVDARLVVVDRLSPQPKEKTMTATAWETQEHETADIKRWLVTNPPITIPASEDTIELAHKSLVSDWSLLRQWLQNSRAILRQQRELEARARIWHERGQPTHAEYLLGQQILKDVQQFLKTHGQDISSIAQKFLDVSQHTARYQRWKTRGIAVLLPLAMMAGMTVSLVRRQLVLRIGPTNSPPVMPTLFPTSALKPQLPERWGASGVTRLTITSQVLAFNQTYSQSEIGQFSISQLANLMTPSGIMTHSGSLPDTPSRPLNGVEHE